MKKIWRIRTSKYLIITLLIAFHQTRFVAQNDATKISVQASNGITVNTWNGNLYYSIPLIRIPGHQLPVTAALNYNSTWKDYKTPYGFGWNLNYHIFYTRETNGDILIARGNGRTDRFLFKINDGSYAAPPAVYDVLKEYKSGRFLLRTKTGVSYYFDSAIDKRVTRIEDANGNTIYFSYDPKGLLTAIAGVSGLQALLEYADGKLSRITDHTGRKFEFQYDAAGNLSAVTNPANHTVGYSYNGHLLTGVTDALLNTTSIAYVGAAVSSVNHTGAAWNFSYDAETHATSVNYGGQTKIYIYDEQDKIKTMVDPSGFTEHYSWDANDNIASMADENGNTTQYDYDYRGNITKITDASGAQTAYAYEPLFNRISSITNASGSTSAFEYDDKGNLLKSNLPLGISFQYAYDTRGNVVSANDGRGVETSYAFDPHGNLTEVHQPLGDKTFTYDLSGNLLSSANENGNATTYTYDPLDRLVGVQDPLGHSIQFTYDANGNRTSVTDPKGFSNTVVYDALNRPVSVLTPAGAIGYAYDQRGNLTSLSNLNGTITAFQYDNKDQLLAETDPLGHSTTYTYDPAGNRIGRTDALGQQTTYTYDALNRLTAKNYVGNSESFTYDALGNVTMASNNQIQTNYSYDALSRLSAKTVANWNKSVDYAYDGNNNRIKMTDPDGGETIYIYDDNNRLTALQNPSGLLTGFIYDPVGRVVRQNNANSTYTTYSYDAADRLLMLSNFTPSGAVMSSYAYTYDANGNRLTMTDQNGGVNQYQYDAVDQVTGVTYSDGAMESYLFDPQGNRQQVVRNGSPEVYAHNAGDQLLARGNVSYAFDANGNLIQKTENGQETLYSYDGENRLLEITFPDGKKNQYAYMPSGLRIQSTGADGSVKRFFYDEGNTLLELDATGNPSARYTSGPGLDSWLIRESAGDYYTYHKDGLGSITALADNAGAVANAYRYDIYGNLLEQTAAVENPYQFTGRRLDSESGLYYYRTRYYDNRTGKFTTTDPIGFGGGPNQYRYVDNNPINYIDPTGQITLPFTPRHRNRNQYNKIPSNEPKYDPQKGGYYDTEGNKWIFQENNPFHGDNRTYVGTGPNFGSQSTYDQNGNPINSGPNQGTFDYSPPTYFDNGWPNPLSWPGHFFEDMFPGFFDPNYTPSPMPSPIPNPCCAPVPSPPSGGGGGGGMESGRLGSPQSAFLEGRVKSIVPATLAAEATQKSALSPLFEPAAKAADTFDKSTFLDVHSTSAPVSSAAKPTLPPGQISIADILPSTGPPSTNLIVATPQDVQLGIGNVTETQGYNFTDPNNGKIRAAIIGITTTGFPYSHEYATCGRFHDYVLHSAAAVPLADLIPGMSGPAWFWYATTSKDSLVEECFLFNVFVEEAQQRFTIDSRWLSDTYPHPSPGFAYDYVFNLQVWASTATEALILVKGVLDKLRGIGGWTMAFNNTAEPVQPDILAKTVQVIGTSVRMHVQSWQDEPKAVRFFGTYRSAADWTTNIDFELEKTIAPGFQVVDLPLGDLIDAVILYEVDSFLDKLYAGGGFWFVADDGGGASAAKLELPNCSVATNLTSSDLSLPGCARLDGKVAKHGFVVLGRTLNPNGLPVDISPYEAVSFRAKGDGKTYRVLLESRDVSDAGSSDFHQAVFTTSADWRQYVIPILKFRQQLSDTIPFDGQDVKSIVFSSIWGPHDSVSLSVEGVAFIRSTRIAGTTALPHTQDVSGPYPVAAQITDDQGIVSASLHYSTDGGTVFSEIPMNPFGNLFNAAIPGQPLGTEALYYIRAEDADGNVATDPVDVPYTTYRFQVSDKPFYAVDDFKDTDPDNLNGWDNLLFESPGASIFSVYDKASVKLHYNAVQPNSFAGYISELAALDATPYSVLSFHVKGDSGSEIAKVGLKDKNGFENKIVIGEYLVEGIATEFRNVSIPLASFGKATKLSGLENLVIAFEQVVGSGSGAIYLDDIKFETLPYLPVVVDNFNDKTGENGVGGAIWAIPGGNAVLTADYDALQAFGNYGASYKITYNLSHPGDWAVVVWDMDSIDIAGAKNLSFRIKGLAGGEQPNIYLVSRTGGTEVKQMVDIENYGVVVKDWKNFEIPLQNFVKQGIDLTTLTQVQLAFEWALMQGTIWVDDMVFSTPLVVATGAVSAVRCHGGSDGSATIATNGGIPPYQYQWSNGNSGPTATGLTAGSYTVTVTDNSDNVTILTVTIAEPDPLLITVDSIHFTSAGQSNGFIDVSVSGGVPPYTYQWVFNGNNISNDEDISNLSAGFYALQLTDSNGCILSLNEFEVESTVRVAEHSRGNLVTLVPNPTSGKIKVIINNQDVNAMQFEVYDVLGRGRCHPTCVEYDAGRTYQLDLSPMANGVYILSVNFDNRVLLFRVVVSK